MSAVTTLATEDAASRHTWLQDCCAILSGLLLETPPPEALQMLAKGRVLADLAERAPEVIGHRIAGLDALDALLASGSAAQAAMRDEHVHLFKAATKLAAPPWESVYRSPDRLVMQRPAFEVLQAYLDAGLGYDDMQRCPPDHVGRELGFVAALLARASATDAPSPDELQRAREFWGEHLATWLPSFCADLERASTAGYQHVATWLGALVAQAP